MEEPQEGCLDWLIRLLFGLVILVLAIVVVL
jgi:hypothetical protein